MQLPDYENYAVGNIMQAVATIITYHPDKNLLRKNIAAIYNECSEILIWRNSDDDLSDICNEFQNVRLMGDGTNRFIAYPLNQALEWCRENGYDYLLTMDQDSVWENFAGFLKKVESLDSSDNTIIYAPNVNNEFSAETLHPETVITSGSLVNVEKALQIGGFKEKYEIYWVDGEFCFRARKNGYQITMLPEYNLIQQFGHQTRTLFGFKTSNYSPLIYYYLVRNMLWEHREHGSEAVSWRCILYTLMYTSRGIVLGEKQKMKKLTKITKGIIHGFFLSYK